ncbi:MAG: GNAT family N-acetyltransferase, partial [Desulfuromonadales bacterium]|nr:GNAT family N-acetyltransferase [Desulfuromonadales bacterium]
MNAEFIRVDDPRWKRLLGQVSHDFYHTPEYLELCGRYEDGEPGAFWAESEDSAFLVPLLRRKIPASLGAPDGWWDLYTPYGYPSPLLTRLRGQESGRFMEAFTTLCQKSECVSGFLRLHPLLPLPPAMLSLSGTVLRHGETVFIDLEEAEEAVWKGVRENHRRDIRKLANRGFIVELDAWERLPEFIALYHATMRRLDASPFYFFPTDYFRDLRKALRNDLHLCTVLTKSGEVASAGLFVGTDRIVEYHLGGTAEDYL